MATSGSNVVPQSTTTTPCDPVSIVNNTSCLSTTVSASATPSNKSEATSAATTTTSGINGSNCGECGGDQVVAKALLPPSKELRPYQLELLEICKRGNTIISLDTNTGKTLIAVALAKWMHSQYPRKKVFFIVQNINLATQQAREFIANCELEVDDMFGGHCGNWNFMMKTNDVLAFTAQVLCNELPNNPDLLDDVSLIIFDECHHTLKGHPFKIIMDHLNSQHKLGKAVPLILGLTASLASRETLGETIISTLNMCSNLRSVVCTADTTSYYELTQEDVYELMMDGSSVILHDVIISIMRELTRKLSLCKSSFSQGFEPGSENFSQWAKGQKRVLPREDISIQRAAFPLLKVLRILNRGLIFLDEISCKSAWDYVKRELGQEETNAEAKLLCIETLEKIRGSLFKEKISEDTLPLESAKLHQLRDILAMMHNKSHKILLFVKTRKSVSELLGILEKDLPITSRGITGHGSKKMTPTAQREILDQFHAGKFDMLITTSVVEEGLNVPKCNMVIRYDAISSTLSLIQSRGRARQPGSRFLVIYHKIEKGQWYEMKKRESLMKRAIGIVSKGLRTIDLSTNEIPLTLSSPLWSIVLEDTQKNLEIQGERAMKVLCAPKQYLINTCSVLFGENIKTTFTQSGPYFSCTLQAGPCEFSSLNQSLRQSEAENQAVNAGITFFLKRDLVVMSIKGCTQAQTPLKTPIMVLGERCKSFDLEPPQYVTLPADVAGQLKWRSTVTILLPYEPISVCGTYSATKKGAEEDAATAGLEKLESVIGDLIPTAPPSSTGTTAPELGRIKSKLNMFCQKNRLSLPQYETIAAPRPQRVPLFYCSISIPPRTWTTPTGSTSKKEAEDSAAALVLADLEDPLTAVTTSQSSQSQSPSATTNPQARLNHTLQMARGKVGMSESCTATAPFVARLTITALGKDHVCASDPCRSKAMAKSQAAQRACDLLAQLGLLI
ncbi:melanoma differentiation associated protein-5 [Pelomyxa schiedti]|nr:melanoma differentiation associated protein-5 [Pelomyxa schiedti]